MPDWATTAFFKANASNWIGQVGRMHDKMSGFLGAVKMNAERAIPGLNMMKKAFGSIAGQVAIGNLVSMGIQRAMSGMVDLVKSVPEFAERAQQIGRTATIVGTSAESWQRLAYAAKMTDTSTEGLQGAMQKLNRNMADLTVGKGTLMDLVKFGPPGLGAMIRKTHDSGEALMLLADAFQKTHDPQVRARMAVAAFGKAGQEMIPMLARGRMGLMAFMQEARGVIPDKTIMAAERFGDAWKKTQATLQDFKNRILGQLLERFQPFLDKFLKWVDANHDLIDHKIDAVFSGIAGALKTLADAWKTIQDLTGGHAVESILILTGAWKGLVFAIGVAKAAQQAFNLLKPPAVPTGLPGGGGAGVAGKVLGIGGSAAGAIGAAELVPALGGLAILAAVYYGAHQYAKTGGGAVNLNPNNALLSATAAKNMMANPAAMYMAGIMTPAMANALNQQVEAPNAGQRPPVVNVGVNVDNSRAPGTTSGVRVAPPLSGRQGAQFGFAGG